MRQTTPAIDRVLARVIAGQGGCWLWTGAATPLGYGTVCVGTGASKTRQYAHRVVYEEFVGPIPSGLSIDHLCRVPRCVNPEHLEAVTHRENTRRGESPGAKAQRTGVCVRGHDLSDAYVRKDNGHRMCRECRRQREHEYRQQQKERTA